MKNGAVVREYFVIIMFFDGAAMYFNLFEGFWGSNQREFFRFLLESLEESQIKGLTQAA